jgi:hypothetical protein
VVAVLGAVKGKRSYMAITKFFGRSIGFFVWLTFGCAFGFVFGICYLYITQDYYPDSIKVVAISIIFCVIGSLSSSRKSTVVGLIMSCIASFLLYTILPSNASIIENPYVPMDYTTDSIVAIDSSWSTLNELMIYVNPQYACEATKGVVAGDIAKKLNFSGNFGDKPEDYLVTDVIPNGSDESWYPKPNVVCKMELTTDNGIIVDRFNVVASSSGYGWSEVDQ